MTLLRLSPVSRDEQWQESYRACGTGELTTPCQHTGLPLRVVHALAQRLLREIHSLVTA